MHQGYQTGKFGCHLAQAIEASTALAGWRVFYDHGDPQRDHHVAAIKGFFGTGVANFNRLADIDVLVASPDNVVRLIIEIEERPSPPKKLLGDVLAIMLCNHAAVRVQHQQEIFGLTQDTRLIVAGIVGPGGNALKKITEIILPRLRELHGLADGISPTKIGFVFTPEIVNTLEALWSTVASDLGVNLP
jgi:hypothetical protein